MREYFPTDVGHYVRMAAKLSKRLGIARARARRAQLDFEGLREMHIQMRQDLSDLAHQVRVLREANRVLGELVDTYERDAYDGPPLALEPAAAEPKLDPFTDPTVGF